MAIDGEYAGHILISDIMKPHAKEAIENAEKSRHHEERLCSPVTETRWQSQVAAELGIGEVHSELLPADKVAKVEELLANKSEKEKLGLRWRRNQ